MNIKKVIYIGVVFCLTLLFQISAEKVTLAAADEQPVSEQTDFLLPDDGQDHEVQFNDQAIVPVSGNAINGRQNSSPSSARAMGSKRLQARFALTDNLLCAATVLRPGNFIDGAFMRFPSGLYSTNHHLMLLRKLRN